MLESSLNPGTLCLLETKTKEVRSFLDMGHMAANKGFDSSFMVNLIGLPEGLLLVWNKDHIKIDVDCYCSEVIHCVVSGLGRHTNRLSFAYVRPNRRAKDFFGTIVGLILTRSSLWILLRDVNDITCMQRRSMGKQSTMATSVASLVLTRLGPSTLG